MDSDMGHILQERTRTLLTGVWQEAYRIADGPGDQRAEAADRAVQAFVASVRKAEATLVGAK